MGKDVLIYKVNGIYLKELEAWQAILSLKVAGVNILPAWPVKDDEFNQSNTRFLNTTTLGQPANKPSDKIFKAYRPGSEMLKNMDLKLGENNLVYEYHVTETVKDKVEVKIFMYTANCKMIISDIDGTITKYCHDVNVDLMC